MSEITADEMTGRLAQEFPEVKKRFDEEIEWWGDEKPGPHIIMGDIFNPFVIGLLETSGDKQTLERAFVFLEDLAARGNDEVENVVTVTICESLVGNGREIYERAKRFMGQATKEICEEVAKNFNV